MTATKARGIQEIAAERLAELTRLLDDYGRVGYTTMRGIQLTGSRLKRAKRVRVHLLRILRESLGYYVQAYKTGDAETFELASLKRGIAIWLSSEGENAERGHDDLWAALDNGKKGGRPRMLPKNLLSDMTRWLAQRPGKRPADYYYEKGKALNVPAVSVATAVCRAKKARQTAG